MNQRWMRLLLIVMFVLGLVTTAFAQEDEAPLELRLRRDFGYGSGLKVQGRFSMRVSAPDDVERVEFLIDDQVIGEDGEAPFALQFHTDNYEVGWHTMQAMGYRAGGQTAPSNSIRREFVPASTANWTTFGILGLVLAFVVLRYVLTRKSAATSYGMIGGTVCPNCGRPFAYHLWSINLMAGRFDRCPHCGKWSFTRRRSPQELAEVEAEMDDGETSVVPELSEEQRLRRQLDSSRYEDVP